MKKRNESWTCYLKTHIGRKLLWFSIVLSATSLFAAGMSLSLQVQSVGQASSSTLPSDEFPDEHFLTFNAVSGTLGPDNAESACKYYNAIGAIRVGAIRVDLSPLCPLAPDVVLTFGITFNDWKLENGLEINPDKNGNRNPFDDDDATGEVSALYFNAVDLELVRSMHGKTSVVNGEKTTAYYVCNYMEFEVAKADPDNSKAIACVAFDYSANRPFTKFYVFQRGSLVASAELDGKGQKFVPGLCKACHGADNQARQPFTNNVVNGNIGAHFLPFDLDNFDYLEDSEFTRRAQESKFKRLNEMIVDLGLLNPQGADPAPVVRELIEGWYPGGRTEQDSDFIPPGWMGNEQLYRRVVKPSCRTCHVAMRPGFNFETLAGFTTLGRTVLHDRVCVDAGVNLPPEEARPFRSMPNSKVTFDQFWLDRVQGAVLARFLRDALRDPSIRCPPP